MFETMAVEIEQLLGKVIHKLLIFILKYHSTGFCDECLESNSMGGKEVCLMLCISYKGKLFHLIHCTFPTIIKRFRLVLFLCWFVCFSPTAYWNK